MNDKRLEHEVMSYLLPDTLKARLERIRTDYAETLNLARKVNYQFDRVTLLPVMMEALAQEIFQAVQETTRGLSGEERARILMQAYRPFPECGRWLEWKAEERMRRSTGNRKRTYQAPYTQTRLAI